jgi:hypothetical protein
MKALSRIVQKVYLHKFKIVFIAWTAVWLLFLVRGLVKGEARDYKNLLGKNLEEKRAYVTGEEFYEFIRFCREIIPEDADYTVEANYDQSMDYFRFAYYILPSLRDLEDPEYIVCYKNNYKKSGYKQITALSADKYILKRKR